MRVVLITNFFLPNHIGGTELYTYRIAQGLVGAGHQVNVVCVENWEHGHRHQVRWEDGEYNGLTVRRFHLNWRLTPDPFRYLYDNPEVGRVLNVYLKQLNPDIIHIMSCNSLSARPILVARRLNIPVVLTLTDFWYFCPRNTLLRGDGTLCMGPKNTWECLECQGIENRAFRFINSLPGGVARPILIAISKRPEIIRALHMTGCVGNISRRKSFLIDAMRQANLILAPSHFLLRMYIQNGAPKESIIYSSFGFDIASAKTGRVKSSSKKLRIGFIGSLVPIKGADILLRSFRRLPKNAQVTLKIYGDLGKLPLYSAKLLDLARNDSRIEFKGTFSVDHVGQVFKDIDVLVVPSIWYENTPLVIYSAFASATPVVATDLDGMSELVKNQINGLLFARGDEADLEKKLQQIIDSPNLLKTWSKNISSIKSMKENVLECIELYSQLLN